MSFSKPAACWPEADAARLLPGDRLELRVTGQVDRFRLSPCGEALAVTIEGIELPDGRLLPGPGTAGASYVDLPGAAELLGARWPALWLESLDGRSFRLVLDEELEQPPSAAGIAGPAPAGKKAAAPSTATTESAAPGLAALAESEREVLLRAVSTPASLLEYRLGMRAARLAIHGGFDQLISLPLLREMEVLEHQVRTAKTVLRRLHGRALLCDEVGLGKTIEAGMIAKELLTRGLIRSLLIVAPPSLVEQWQGELRRKFSIDCCAYDDPAFRAAGVDAWQRFDRVIVSLHTAKREPHRAAIAGRRWDLVIVDEAHHLRNRNTVAWRFASELEKQFVLLLTATPVQNNLDELFNLVTLLEPGLLSTSRTFQQRFVDRHDRLTPKNVEQLHALLAEVMVRNRRSTVGLSFTRRWAQTLRVSPSAPERRLYDGVSRLVRRGLRAGGGESSLNRMVLIKLQLALGSSAAAAAAMLDNLSQRPRAVDESADLAALAHEAAAVRNGAKTGRLLALLQQFADKLVVFTQFRATQEELLAALDAAGHEVAVFHGGLSRLDKERAIAQFRGPANVLLTTDAGSEGRNLQFAHGICNFDLPWNPMKIEQRIGRLSRIGQTHDVHVFNLVAADTLEAALLHLLEAKLSLFELVIGEVDMILGNLEDEREFDDVVTDLWADSADSADFARRMEALGDRLLAAKEAYFSQRAHDDRLFGNRFAPDG